MSAPRRPMKFSTFNLFHRFDGMSVREVYDYNLELAEYVEELGFDGFWIAEHHFRGYGVVPCTPALLSYIAARTERLRLGTGIVVLPLHNPVHIAEQIAQLDVLSGGRVDFGVGRGYQSVEFESFGLDLAEARDRFNEGLEVIQGLWTQDEFSHEGPYYRTGTINLVPKPEQKPHPPVYVAAVSPETVELYAARGLPILADPAAPFKKVGRAAEAWHAAASAAGHDDADIELVITRAVYVAPTVEQARADQERFEKLFDRSRIFNAQSAPIDSATGQVAKGFEYWQDRYLKGGAVDNDFRWEQLEVIGDPERVISQIRMLQEFGYSQLMCDFGSTRPIPLDEMKKTLRFFAKEVIPAFR
ncbi:LLM class flavin-dependent oxidoreductase [Streptomyces sp. NPDC101225]|uniref:LLM class flavin-dependent oxidoreductase n=1 Tax=Streptomyces sp. NPDC101225 TaxID=3366135 RepID=UPI00381BC44E